MNPGPWMMLYTKSSVTTQEDDTIFLQIYPIHVFIQWEDPIPEKDKTYNIDMWQKTQTTYKKEPKQPKPNQNKQKNPRPNIHLKHN